MARWNRFRWCVGALLLVVLAGTWSVVSAQTEPEHSTARLWNERLMAAIRTDIPKPPVHARNLFHLSVAMWDAWAAYDPSAQGYLYTNKETAPPLGSGGSGGAWDAKGTKGMFGVDDSGALGSLGAPGEDGGSYQAGIYGWSDDEGLDDEGLDDEGGDNGGGDDEVPEVEVKAYDAAVEAARAEAVSFAAYRLLQYRFPTGTTCHAGAVGAQAGFDAQMDALGYDKTFADTVGPSPAAVGNRIAAMIIAYGQTDGSNEGPFRCHPDDTNYQSSNLDLIFKLPGNPGLFEPNHWQKLAFDLIILQNGIILGAGVQTFIGVGWGDVLPFAVGPADIPAGPPSPDCWTVSGIPQPYFDPGCPPQLAGVGDATVKAAILENIRFSSYMDATQGVIMDISPGAIGNNSLGADDGTGHPLNPVTRLPYAPNLVKRADWAGVVTQSWSDGPQSETPPGHWNVLYNEVVNDNPSHVRRIGGAGPILNALEFDVKTYIALNGAVHDAAISAWSTKHYYDSSRPISLIRYMATLGQSSDAGQLSYHPDGLLLEPGLVEVITADSVLPGGKFEHLKAFCAGGGPATNTGLPCTEVDADTNDAECPDDGPFNGFCQSSVGKIAIYAWLGPPVDPVNTTAGVGWKLAETWMPWFPKTFVTPPFPGYVSGHSTFSRSGAEVLAAITGSPYFPGGLGTFSTIAHVYTTVEDGPSQDLTLQWATYFDAADEAGISRRLGGIHPFYDDFPARVMGSQIGQKAYARALELYGPSGGSPAAILPDGEPVFGKAPRQSMQPREQRGVTPQSGRSSVSKQSKR